LEGNEKASIKASFIQQADGAEENFLVASTHFNLWQYNISSTWLIQTLKRKECWGD